MVKTNADNDRLSEKEQFTVFAIFFIVVYVGCGILFNAMMTWLSQTCGLWTSVMIGAPMVYYPVSFFVVGNFLAFLVQYPGVRND